MRVDLRLRENTWWFCDQEEKKVDFKVSRLALTGVTFDAELRFIYLHIRNRARKPDFLYIILYKSAIYSSPTEYL